MALHLITGYAGMEHITSADQGAYNSATFGSGEFVLDRGQKFAYTILSNNAIQIADGEAMMQGRYIKMSSGTSEELTITNGTQGKKRNDLICIRYEKSAADSTESTKFVVIKGEEADSNPTDPQYTHGNITDGEDTVNEMPLYRVSLDGINIDSVTALYTTKVSMVEYMDNYQIEPATANRLGGVKVGNDIKVSADGTINLTDITYARTIGNTSDRKLGFGDSFLIPYITINAQGRVTSGSGATYKLPSYSKRWFDLEVVDGPRTISSGIREIQLEFDMSNYETEVGESIVRGSNITIYNLVLSTGGSHSQVIGIAKYPIFSTANKHLYINTIILNGSSNSYLVSRVQFEAVMM